jgi:bifunctional enzyme CysN/CysC
LDTNASTREQMSIAIVGHVDHGKSTVVGRLLADTGRLPEEKIERIREKCRRTSKPFEYAFLLDALKDEQSQGITIDSARCFFRTDRRDYTIIDAPGHIEFLKNMVSGAARAEAALIVIDAAEGIQENSRRHGYLLSMLGVGQIMVCVNKMDLVDYDQGVFDAIERDYRAFLSPIGVTPLNFIPISARDGENIAAHSERTPWYQGPNVLEALDGLQKEAPDESKPLRMPVQDVYKFTAMGDSRRLIAGRIESGRLHVGDTVLFSPSNKRSQVKSIETFNTPPKTAAQSGESVAFTLTEQIYVTRGEMVSRADEPPPQVSSRFRARVVWLGRRPMTPDRRYKLKLCTAEAPVVLEEVTAALDANSLNLATKKARIERHDVAECILSARRPMLFDPNASMPSTGRFVLVDEYEIAGGGIIVEALPDQQSRLRDQVFIRDGKWVPGAISSQERSERLAQRSALILITGHRGVGRKRLANALEQYLFSTGRFVYFLGIGSIVYGLDADIAIHSPNLDATENEHIRRLGETLHVLLDAGLIVLCTAIDLSAKSIDDIRTLIGPVPVTTICVGQHDLSEADLRFPDRVAPDVAIPQVVSHLKRAHIIPDVG